MKKFLSLSIVSILQAGILVGGFSASAKAQTLGHLIRYPSEQPDGSRDILTVRWFGLYGPMTLEQTRQVGGRGGISEEGVVPYETVC